MLIKNVEANIERSVKVIALENEVKSNVKLRISSTMMCSFPCCIFPPNNPFLLFDCQIGGVL
jgi:peroxin-6